MPTSPVTKLMTAPEYITQPAIQKMNPKYMGWRNLENNPVVTKWSMFSTPRNWIKAANEKVGVERPIDATASAGCHGRRIEHRRSIPAIQQGVKTLDNSFEKPVHAIRPCDLEKRT